MVIKQTRCRWWKGEIWKPDVPTEVVALETINKGPIQPTGCIDYLDYQRYPAREVHRIYMEYAPYGDLFRLIQKYRAKKYVTTGSGDDDTDGQLQTINTRGIHLGRFLQVGQSMPGHGKYSLWPWSCPLRGVGALGHQTRQWSVHLPHLYPKKLF